MIHIKRIKPDEYQGVVTTIDGDLIALVQGKTLAEAAFSARQVLRNIEEYFSGLVETRNNNALEYIYTDERE